MTDIFTPEKRSEVMARIRSTGNKDTELKLMAALREADIKGWRRHAIVKVAAATAGGVRTTSSASPRSRAGEKPKKTAKIALKVRPDFVFWRARVALFVDGCFWHGCPRHGTRPRQNGEFWSAKILRNQARDRKVSRVLRRDGWSVLRIWECTLTPRRIIATLARVKRALERK
ncbi:very short patch repair endonuclease [Prosthecobacter sp. SYSU 5D2]|uniref:very short patch repair endonuclease n=1 Tax=Prosthecobacter sp. SYSU 5D2 TaxID=3134134 RepID=UPI0031FE8C60